MHQWRYLAYGENTHTLRLTSELVDLRVGYAKWIRRAKLAEQHRMGLHSYDAPLCIITMERYRSGHNGADSKSVCAKAHEGSNPSLSAIKIASGFCRSLFLSRWERGYREIDHQSRRLCVKVQNPVLTIKMNFNASLLLWRRERVERNLTPNPLADL